MAHYRALESTRFFREALASESVIGTEEVDLDVAFGRSAPAPTDPPRWAGVLSHRTVPFISYPYEWSFSMLQDAALLQLNLLDQALAENFVLKDASAYNIQWVGHRPVFIDIASFERRAEGDPWMGYLQFCQLFLYPLMLTAYRDVPFQPLLRGAIDGVEPEVASALFSVRDRLRPGVLMHAVVQSRLKRSMADRKQSLREEVRQQRLPKRLIVNNVRGLRKLITRLDWQPRSSTWSDYGTDHSYSEADHESKERFVRRASERTAGPLLWDVGCNNGRFTKIAAPYFECAVAMDFDHLAVDRLYRGLKTESPGNILPLVNNLADPSPALGWRGLERKSLEQRGRPDLTLALALMHHLVIGANLPVPEVIAWFAGLGEHLVLEYVSKDDPMTKRLLLDKVDHYDDYEPEAFQSSLGQRYEILESLELGSGTRTLYFCRRRSSG